MDLRRSGDGEILSAFLLVTYELCLVRGANFSRYGGGPIGLADPSILGNIYWVRFCNSALLSYHHPAINQCWSVLSYATCLRDSVFQTYITRYELEVCLTVLNVIITIMPPKLRYITYIVSA
jgi:hypothetical protein